MASPGFSVGQRSLPTALDIDVIVDAFQLPQDQYDDLTLPVAGVPTTSPIPGGDSGLRECSPNPTRGTSRVTFALSRYGAVRLEILDVQGRRIRTLVQGAMRAGLQSVEWNGKDDEHVRVPAGIYLARLWVDAVVSGQRRIVVLR